ncbi:MAG: LLM class flavin-dependent oxidoreductase [Chloroflexota bacterium]
MKIGLGVYSTEVLPGEQRTLHQVYQDHLAEARLAEEVGLDSIWYTEHHFLPETGHNPNVMGMCAAAAAVTTRITLGPAVLLGPLYHPIRLAEDCAMVDQLSGGRLTVGIGLGYRDVEFEGLGVHRRERAPRTEELIDVLRQAWGEGTVNHQGRYYRLTDVHVSPSPCRPGGPKIWTAGYRQVSLERAARLADGFIMDAGTDSTRFTEKGYNTDVFSRVAEVLGWYKQALTNAGRRYQDVDFGLNIGGFLSEHGSDAAWNVLKESYMHTRRVYGDWYGLPPEVYRRWQPAMMTADEIAGRRSEILLGSPEELLPVFRRFRELAGDRLHVLFRNSYPGLSHENTAKAIRLMGQLRDRLLED